MKSLRFVIIARLILVAFTTAASVASAQSSTTTAGSITTTTPAKNSPATATNPSNKLVDSYTDLAGSRENASSLVNGLRTGSAITLTDPSVPPSNTPPPPSTTFSPGTKPMGYGNVRIALSLARTQLASQGITNPTPEQLQGALVGTSGTTGTSSQGVLQMRASGMGWGEIANSMGVKLGAVMSGKQTFPTNTGTTTTTTTTGTTTGTATTTAAGTSTAQGSGSAMSQQHSKSGVVTAAGTSVGATNTSHGKSGITTAAGGSAGGGSKGVTTGLGSSNGNASSGAVNASGGGAGGTAGSNAGGQGRGKP